MSAKIWIEPTGKTLRLVWYYQGKRQRLSLGVADNPIGRALANKKMADIKIDLESGHYDETLLRYKPRKLGANPTEISAVDLFGKYVIHYKKNHDIAHGSGLRLKAIASKLEQFLGDKQANKVTESVAEKVVARWAESASVQTIKSYLYYLKGCWDWAKDKYHVVEPNPWDDCLIRSRSRGNSKPSKQKKPFTIAELQAIISAFAFANNPYYAHYTEFIIFLTNTACRFGEVAGLRMVISRSSDYSTGLDWGIYLSRPSECQKGTKTGKSRTIQLPPTVKSSDGTQIQYDESTLSRTSWYFPVLKVCPSMTTRSEEEHGKPYLKAAILNIARHTIFDTRPSLTRFIMVLITSHWRNRLDTINA